MQQTYPVSDTNPISIDPAGLGIRKTVFNIGTNTVYLTENPIGSNGFPLTAGNSLGWEPKTPLYAYVVAGAPTSVIVTDTAIVQPQNDITATVGGNVNAAVTGNVTSLGAFDFLENVGVAASSGTATITSSVLDVSTYQALRLSYFGTDYTNYLTAYQEEVLIEWYQDISGSNFVRAELVSFISMTNSAGRGWYDIPVQAPYVKLTMTGISPDPGIGFYTRFLAVYGSQNNLNRTYFSGGTSDATHTETLSTALTTINLATSATTWWYPTHYSGPAKLLVYPSATATNALYIEVSGYARSAAFAWQFNPTAYVAQTFDFIAPRYPVKVRIQNGSASVAQTTLRLALSSTPPN